MSRELLLLIVLVGLSAGVMAQDRKEALLDEIYLESGFETQVMQIPTMVKAGFDQSVGQDEQAWNLSPEVIAQIRESVNEAFDPREIKQVLMHELRQNLSVDDLEQIRAWLGSDLGHRLSRLEEATTTPESHEEFQRYLAELRDSPPPPERVVAIQRLDAVVRASETSLEIALNTRLAVTIAISASLPQEQQPSYEQLLLAMADDRAEMEASMRSQIPVYLLYTYRDISNPEIDEYIDFASSAVGSAYHQVAISGMERAMKRAAFRWGQLIGEILRSTAGRTLV